MLSKVKLAVFSLLNRANLSIYIITKITAQLSRTLQLYNTDVWISHDSPAKLAKQPRRWCEIGNSVSRQRLVLHSSPEATVSVLLSQAAD